MLKIHDGEDFFVADESTTINNEKVDFMVVELYFKKIQPEHFFRAPFKSANGKSTIELDVTENPYFVDMMAAMSGHPEEWPHEYYTLLVKWEDGCYKILDINSYQCVKYYK